MIDLGASRPATDLGIAIGVDRAKLAPFPSKAPAATSSQASFGWSNTQAGIQILPFARQVTDAQEHKDAATEKWSGIASDAIIDGWLAGGYLDMVKHSNYPWWWGQVRGWPDISAALKRDIAVMEASRLPSGIKAIATANMNAAWIWAKEQWAGRSPVAI